MKGLASKYILNGKEINKMQIDDTSMGSSAESGMSWCDIAASAYRAYAASTGHKNYQGLPMPHWHDLPPTIQTAWEAAVRQVRRCLNNPELAVQFEEDWNGWLPPHRREVK